jgi:hypothetical protein
MAIFGLFLLVRLLQTQSAPSGDAEARQVMTGSFPPFIEVAGAEGIEPSTFGFGDRRSAN